MHALRVNLSSSIIIDVHESLDVILIILSAILLPIKSPLASAFFRISLFEAVFNASVVTLVTSDFLALSRSFWAFFSSRLSRRVTALYLVFLAKDKNP